MTKQLWIHCSHRLHVTLKSCSSASTNSNLDHFHSVLDTSCPPIYLCRWVSGGKKSQRKKNEITGSGSDFSRCCNRSSFLRFLFPFFTICELLEVFLYSGLYYLELYAWILAVYHSPWRMLAKQGNLMNLPTPNVCPIMSVLWSNIECPSCILTDMYLKMTGDSVKVMDRRITHSSFQTLSLASLPGRCQSQISRVWGYKKAFCLPCWVMSVSN